MTQRAEGDGKPIPCSGKQQLSCKAIPPGLDALTTARVGICRPMRFRHLRCPKVSKGRAESPLVRPLAHTSCRRPGGLTRRLRRGWWGCRPEGGSTFFRSERKYQRKHAARRYGKKPFIAHFDGGARNVARNEFGQLSLTLGARSCSPFSAVKMGGPFSLRCLSPLVSAAAWVGAKVK